jgi:predicted RNase H-like HicB family nuclease
VLSNPTFELTDKRGLWYFYYKGDNMKLHGVIEKDESGYFVAEVPALPGCLSQGKTREEALTNIKEAIEGWFEVMESKQSFDRTRLVELTV